MGSETLRPLPENYLRVGPIHSRIEQLAARCAHNAEVEGSNPSPATMAYKDKNKDKECKRNCYLNNKSLYKSRAKQGRIKSYCRNRTFVKSYLCSHPCIDCGETDWRCLEFDHRENKRASISKMVGNCCSIENIVKEISKCDIRCANCHRIKNHNTIWKKA